jgi:undecaprenyl-diphosphatase
LLFWHLVVLALVQGITEYLPISSSAHLILTPIVLGWEDQGPWLDIAVHVGSLGAVLLYFWRDVATLLLGTLDTARNRPSPARRLLWLVAVASIPVMIAGLVFVKLDLLPLFRSPLVIALTSILFGILLWWVDVRRPQTAAVEGISFAGALRIGMAQVLSLIPGTSRSGITITAARQLNLTRTEAARFSMLLSLPTILGAGLLEAIELATGAIPMAQLNDLLLAGGLAFASAWASIHLMLRWVATASYTVFVVYRVALGAVLIALIAAGILPF